MLQKGTEMIFETNLFVSICVAYLHRGLGNLNGEMNEFRRMERFICLEQ